MQALIRDLIAPQVQVLEVFETAQVTNLFVRDVLRTDSEIFHMRELAQGFEFGIGSERRVQADSMHLAKKVIAEQACNEPWSRGMLGDAEFACRIKLIGVVRMAAQAADTRDRFLLPFGPSHFACQPAKPAPKNQHRDK
jgi:hypothetical protein